MLVLKYSTWVNYTAIPIGLAISRHFRPYYHNNVHVWVQKEENNGCIDGKRATILMQDITKI
ncbi:MAG: hypothetical protein EBY16_06100 [Gammaproteobacteria bacterium]|nr:hypothetical protein [Gammaproteobacteria bacterium]